ncbi:A-1 protein [Novymonas esmeraldas]|uniref:A-1 protein n=1 Tax=Novymonas esmeraldas TaxID=1808958 RepID=A0AAW0F3M7_9TRYP
MEAVRKRHRGDVLLQAADRDGEDDPAAFSEAVSQRHAHHGGGCNVSPRIAAAETREKDRDYAALVSRSAALLARLGQHKVADGKQHPDATQPCALEGYAGTAFRVWCPSDSVGLSSHAEDHKSRAGLMCRLSKGCQTDTSSSLDAQKKLLATELSEFYTLLHLFFS